MMHEARGVPVTGIGCLCAAGATIQEMTRTLFAGERRVTWHQMGSHRHPVFQLDPGSTPDGYLEGPECRRCGRLAVAAAGEALFCAGLTPALLQRRRVGVCVGTTVGSAMNNEAFYREFIAGRRPDVEPIRQYLQANPAAMVAEAFGLKGPRQTVANACSSGSVAIGEAASWIRSGVCDVAVAGGTDVLCNVIHAGFLSLMITDPEPCRPFDRDRRGLNLGEGSGMVVLESQSSAAQRRAPVLACLVGYGNASDAFHISSPDPAGRGLRRAVEQALAQAELEPRDIAFINAHGTGTPENDRVEGRLFPELFPEVPFGSTKGLTGHTLGAAGGIEAAITIICLKEQRIPANVGFLVDDPEFPGRPVRTVTPIHGRYGLSDSVAFGGNNAVLVFAGEAS